MTKCLWLISQKLLRVTRKMFLKKRKFQPNLFPQFVQNFPINFGIQFIDFEVRTEGESIDCTTAAEEDYLGEG